MKRMAIAAVGLALVVGVGIGSALNRTLEMLI